jgi:excisionase family DNA binding protein
MTINRIDGEELGADNARLSSEAPSLNTDQVAKILNCHRNKVHRLVLKGYLPRYKNPITGHVLFKMSDVESLNKNLNTYERV